MNTDVRSKFQNLNLESSKLKLCIFRGLNKKMAGGLQSEEVYCVQYDL